MEYDFIFIDSRTGISDYSGICNLQLPNVNVIIMAANEQNISGCKRIVNQIRNSEYTKQGYRNSTILPILSRINVDHPEFGKWSQRFVAEFHELITELDGDVKAQFSKEIFRDFFLDKTLLEDNPRYSAGENLVFTSDINQHITKNSFVYKYLSISRYIEKLR